MQFYLDKQSRTLNKPVMHWQARLDVPGALHHFMVRGINKTAILGDDQDKARFRYIHLNPSRANRFATIEQLDRKIIEEERH